MQNRQSLSRRRELESKGEALLNLQFAELVLGGRGVVSVVPPCSILRARSQFHLGERRKSGQTQSLAPFFDGK